MYAVPTTDYDTTTTDLSRSVVFSSGGLRRNLRRGCDRLRQDYARSELQRWACFRAPKPPLPYHCWSGNAGSTPDTTTGLRQVYDKKREPKLRENTSGGGGGPVAMEIKDYGVMYAVATTDYGKTTTNTACAATLRQDYDRLRHDYAMSVAFSVLSKTFL